MISVNRRGFFGLFAAAMIATAGVTRLAKIALDIVPGGNGLLTLDEIWTDDLSAPFTHIKNASSRYNLNLIYGDEAVLIGPGETKPVPCAKWLGL